MKIPALFALMILVLPLSAAAQNGPGMDMNQQQMERMMLQARKAQACMEQVDKAALRAIQQESQRFEAALKALCAAGKRDQAQKKALAFGKKMAADPTLRQMKQCAAMMQGMMKDMVPGIDTRFMDRDSAESPSHVCDSL